jgi:hypothetical protein
MALAGLAAHASAASRHEGAAAGMLNGTWKIETPRATAPPDQSDPGYLPVGTSLRLRLLGPSRRAIEEDRRDELGGEVALVPPIPAEICRTALTVNVCEAGRPSDGAERPLPAIFAFSRWTKEDVEEAENSLFVEAGAKIGSGFVLVNVQGSGAEWKLWLYKPGMLIGQYLGIERDRSPVLLPQLWRRVTP